MRCTQTFVPNFIFFHYFYNIQSCAYLNKASQNGCFSQNHSIYLHEGFAPNMSRIAQHKEVNSKKIDNQHTLKFFRPIPI